MVLIPIEYQTTEIHVNFKLQFSLTARAFLIYSILELLAMSAEPTYFTLFPTYNLSVEEIIGFWRNYTIFLVGMDLLVVPGIILLAIKTRLIGRALKNNLITYSYIPLLIFLILRIINDAYTILNIDLLLEAIRIRTISPQSGLPSNIQQVISVSRIIDQGTTLAAFSAFLMLGYGFYGASLSIRIMRGVMLPSFLMILGALLLFFGSNLLVVIISAILMSFRLRKISKNLKGSEEELDDLIGSQEDKGSLYRL